MELFDEEVTLSEGEDQLVVIACGAIAKELLELIRLNGWSHVRVECLPGKLHNRPQLIPAAVEAKLVAAAGRRAFVAYGDCGTGGMLDRVLERHGVERIPGAHCYEFFAGGPDFAAMHEAEPATFYLTDFLCRHFDRFVVEGLGLDRHPELLPQYFGNYHRLVYLAQSDHPELVERAQRAANYLGLKLEVRRTGYGELQTSLVSFVRRAG